MKPLHFISFSGGRTSAYMTRRLLLEEGDKYEFVVTFANTGREHPKTLDFVHQCDVEFGFGTVWLEAVVNPMDGYGTTHKIVSYETADREGKVFESVIAKYGIPSVKSPHCTREMKTNTINSYCSTVGDVWTVPTAIGIRADEQRRCNVEDPQTSLFPLPKRRRRNIRYPLVEWGIEKSDVLDWWKHQPFDLGLEEHQGNCRGCFKMYLPKLVRLAGEDPSAFDWHRRMEQKYEFAKGNQQPHRFFRGGLSVDQLFALYLGSEGVLPRPSREEVGGCSESCEFLPMGKR